MEDRNTIIIDQEAVNTEITEENVVEEAAEEVTEEITADAEQISENAADAADVMELELDADFKDAIVDRSTLNELKPEEIIAIFEQAKAEDGAAEAVKARPKKSKTGGNAEFKKACSWVVFVVLCAAALLTGGMIASEKVAATAPYAITAGDQTICYVSNKAAADKVLSDLVDNYAAEGSDIKAVNNEDISAEQADDAKVDTNGIKNVKEAFALVDEEIQNNDDVKIVVAGTRTDLEKFRPDTVYEKDDTMFAGEAVVKDEGSYGEKEVTKMIKTLNGEVAGTTVIESNVVKEGTPKVVVKGTLGLPDGEDWETYEGDPVFNDADDLIATCKKYMGAPYKYGGHSLTNGIDCVQYVRQMFAKYGISIPNKHSQIQKVGKGVSLSEAQPGDIVCWTHHVGIYIGNGKVINATRRKGVTISSVHMKKKLVTVRRVPRN